MEKSLVKFKHALKLLIYFLLALLVLLLMVKPVGAMESQACNSNPCIFGICVDDVNNSYSCFCIEGYTGQQCEINHDECWSGPCLNGGTCIDGVASYNCTCLQGYFGANCEQYFDDFMDNYIASSFTSAGEEKRALPTMLLVSIFIICKIILE